MTAEVAVMNRAAVALAADSAVTLSGVGPGSQVDKIFQNENKLFELSSHHPIGIMIYNSTSFFDVPWEVIIKDFRREKGASGCPHVFAWKEAFLEYVASHPVFSPSKERQDLFVRGLIEQEFREVFETWNSQVIGLLFDKQTKSVRGRYPVIMKDSIQKRLDLYRTFPFYEGFSDQVLVGVFESYRGEFQSALSDVFRELPLEDIHRRLLEDLAKEILGRATPHWSVTGLVFAGFGSSELFPSLACVEIGGVLSDKLRWLFREKVDIDRSVVTAQIIPFAQRDVVDTLLYGRSKRYESSLVAYFEDSMRQLGTSLVDQLTKSKDRRVDFKRRVENASQAVMAGFKDKHARTLRDAFANDTLDIVRHMPKPDLAAFAESLVTVSSMKRKVTVGPETVGGPVDVAVISRHEGFVWVKRKHYFDAALNPRYMTRAFREHQVGGPNVEAG